MLVSTWLLLILAQLIYYVYFVGIINGHTVMNLNYSKL